MKNLIKLFSIIFAIFIFGCSAQEGDCAVTVEFDDVSKFSDFTVGGMTEEKTLTIFEHELKPFLTKLEKQFLGYDVSLKFLDINMAGEIDPFMRFNSDVRIFKDIYIPILKFTYTVSKNGDVVAGDTVQITDMNYNSFSLFSFNRGSFYYEINVLNNWLRSMR